MVAAAERGSVRGAHLARCLGLTHADAERRKGKTRTGAVGTRANESGRLVGWEQDGKEARQPAGKPEAGGGRGPVRPSPV